MTIPAAHMPITPKLVDGLYTEAMLLADEARAYFDHEGQAERETLDPLTRVAYSCESLRVTTRLMHVVSWLLVRKAIQAGEMSEAEANAPDRHLGRAADLLEDRTLHAELPTRSRSLAAASRDLYGRVSRLDQQLRAEQGGESPARALQGRLQQLF